MRDEDNLNFEIFSCAARPSRIYLSPKAIYPLPEARTVIYFDHNASSPMLPVARQAWIEASETFFGNPSSPHRLGSRAENALNDARDKLGRTLGCSALDIVFTSGATEANNQVLSHFSQSTGAPIWISAIEHPSLLEAARAFAGKRLRLIPVTSEGVADLNWIATHLQTERPALIAVLAANNETGVIQPWRDLSRICRDHDIPFFCDATQWIGKLPAAGLGACDLVTGSAHKFGGPRGVGFLKCPERGKFSPLLHGGPQEEGRRAGTENVPGVLSMIAALECREDQLCNGNKPQAMDKLRFEQRLPELLPGSEIVGGGSERLWNTTMALMPKTDCNQRWVVKLDKIGFAVSTGSACASGKEVPSHVLKAMGFSDEKASRALRFSGSAETTDSDWNALSEALVKVHHSLNWSEPV